MGLSAKRMAEVMDEVGAVIRGHRIQAMRVHPMDDGVVVVVVAVEAEPPPPPTPASGADAC